MILSLASVVFSLEFKSQKKELWRQVPLKTSEQEKAGNIGGEGMQMIFGIAYATSDPKIVYMVSDTSQVWKSIDGGDSWHMSHKGFLSNGGIAVSVDPINENIAFIAGSHGESRGLLYSPADGIYRTTDGGESWKLIKPTQFFRGKEGKHFVFDPKSSNGSKTKIIYAGTHQDGLLISEDSGDNWRSLGFKGERITDIEIDPSDPSVLYLLTVKGLFKVTIENYTISKIERLGKDLTGNFKTFAINPKKPLIIYVTMGEDGVYKSTDGGKKFLKLRTGLPVNLDYTHIMISPVNPDYLYVSVQRWGGLNPLWSHDAGNSWRRPETLDRNNTFITKGRYFSAPIATHPQDLNTALTSGADMIIKTLDGGKTWFYSNNGYTGARKGIGGTSQAFYPDSQKMIFFLIDYGLALTKDGGETFQLLDIPRVGGLETTPVGAVSPDPKLDLIVTAIGGWEKQILAISRNNGKTWKVSPGTEDHYKFIAFHPQKPDIIYAQRFISKDTGNSWKQLPQKVYAIFKGNGDIVYSIDKFGEDKSIIKRSDNQGETWLSPYLYLPIKANWVQEIDVDPSDPDRIYVASTAGFYIFELKNKKWVKKGEESGLTKDHFGLMSFKCVAVDPRHPEVVYTGRWAPGKGHSNGVFRSVDYGKSWRNITYNLGPEFTVWSISVSPHDGVVYIGSSHGTWKLPPPY